jgi:hypothetical protein
MTLKHWDGLLSSDVAGPPGPSGTSEEAVGDVDDVPSMAEKLVVRDAFGDAAMRRFGAAEYVEVGNTGAGKARFQTTTPDALGELQVDPTTGRANLYVNGEARGVALESELLPIWVRKDADAGAMSEIDKTTVVDALGFDVEITGIKWRPSASMNPSTDGNVAQFEFVFYDDTGGLILGASADSTEDEPLGLTPLDAFEQIDIPGAFPVTVPAGGYVTFKMAKEGTGYIVPSGLFTISWRRISG